MASKIESIAAELGEVWEAIHRNDRSALAASRDGRQHRRAKLREVSDRLTARTRVLEFRLSQLRPGNAREALIVAALLHEVVMGTLPPDAPPDTCTEGARRAMRSLVEFLSTAAGATPAGLGMGSYCSDRSTDTQVVPT